MPRKKRIGLIGCGSISVAHVSAYNQIPDKVEVAACCDVDKRAAKVRAEQAGGAAIYSDWNEMLGQEVIHAVDICLPHHLHKQAILDSANAGKHILCEKPLCLDLKEAKSIVETIRKTKVSYMAAHNQVYDPIIREAKRLLDSGAIGKAHYLRTQDCFVYRPLAERRAKSLGWRYDVKKQGGGELIDTGYHPSYLLLFLASSPVVEVASVLGNYMGQLKAEDTAAVTVKFKDGCIGQILTSWAFANPFGAHQIHAIGSKGQLFGSRNDLYLLPTGFQEPAHLHFAGKPGLEAEIEHFVDCLITRRKPETTLQQAVDVLELILKATGRA